MQRRTFITLLGGVVGLPLHTRAQPAAKVPRLGFLALGTPAAWAPRVEALRAGLRDLGYVEGKNLVIEFRWADTIEQLNRASAELVRMDVDIIFAGSSTETEPARRATSSIPIVFATHADPVGLGHAASLPRPGGNMTGLADIQPDTTGKRLEILRETVAHARRIGVLWSATAPSHRPVLEVAQAASDKLGIELLRVSAENAEDLNGAFARLTEDRASAVLVVASTFARVQRALLAELTLRGQLPSMFGSRENVEAGGLMSYAPDHADLMYRAATYIDKILHGAKPADLPVEQASKYQLVINLKIARAIGLTIPQSILARADEVIE
jgi:putative ABC transport system substrate-binding protein